MEEQGAAGLWGVDVSRYQHPGGADIDWRRLMTGGTSFAFIKGSEGDSAGVDANTYLIQDRVQARTAGLPVGVYHYARPNRPVAEDAVAEARIAFSAAGTPRPGSLPQVLDLESNGAELTREEMAEWALTWLAETERLSGQRPILYTYPYFFSAQVAPDVRFRAYPLWVAHYGLPVRTPTVPAPWTSWTFWQFSSQGVQPGVRGHVDLNVFSGSPSDLAQMAGLPRPSVAGVGRDNHAAQGVPLMGNALLDGLTRTSSR